MIKRSGFTKGRSTALLDPHNKKFVVVILVLKGLGNLGPVTIKIRNSRIRSGQDIVSADGQDDGQSIPGWRAEAAPTRGPMVSRNIFNAEHPRGEQRINVKHPRGERGRAVGRRLNIDQLGKRVSVNTEVTNKSTAYKRGAPICVN